MSDFTVLDAHRCWGASGRFTISDLETKPVRTIFLRSNACAVGDLDVADNVLNSAIYSPSSLVLLAKDTTNDSGSMGSNPDEFFGHNVATSMAGGSTFGQAILDHVNVGLSWPWSLSREFHFATAVLLGDPTLRLR